MPFTSEVLTIEGPDDHVATLWLDNPERRNAMGKAFWDDLPRAMEVLAADEAVRIVVLAAKGSVFSAGIDLNAFGGLLQPEASLSLAQQHRRIHREIQQMQAAITSVADCPKPVIAVVQGPCLGAGMDLVTACDLRLAAADAVFAVRETRMAIVADLGTLQRLPRIVGAGYAAEMIYTGQDVPAERARQMGLVNSVHPGAEAVRAAAHEQARTIAANSPLAVQGAKRVLQKSDALTVSESLEYVALWNTAFLPSEDLHEALAAFRERREPTFRGR